MHIGIIGGGAAGMMAAVTAAEHTKVTILEHTDRIGRKLLATGNGKCNFSNLNCSENDYFGDHSSFVKKAIGQFGPRDMLAFLEAGGVLVAEKRGGYLYPRSGQAATILSFFMQRLKETGVSVVCRAEARSVEKDGDRFLVRTGEETYRFDKLILAGGGLAAAKTGSDGSLFSVCSKLGLTTEPQYPVLAPIPVADPQLKLLAGVRADGRVTLKIDGVERTKEEGEIQFNKDSLSGIPVFQLCHEATKAYGEGHEVTLWVDFLPGLGGEETEALIERVTAKREEIRAQELLAGLVHNKAAAAVLDRLKLSPKQAALEWSAKQRKKINSCLHKFVFVMSGQADFDKAQATRGGVSLDEVDGNMMARKHPGLYLVGEMLDVDGKCGGYNLQWAWTSGYIAGRHAAGVLGAGEKSVGAANDIAGRT